MLISIRSPSSEKPASQGSTGTRDFFSDQDMDLYHVSVGDSFSGRFSFFSHLYTHRTERRRHRLDPRLTRFTLHLPLLLVRRLLYALF